MRLYTRGITFLELIVAIAIISLLSSVIFSSLNDTRGRAYDSAVRQEMKQIQTALELYQNDHDGAYPPDVDRGVPPGLEQYLQGGKWPDAPWPGSVYDWDHWQAGDLSYAPREQVVQLSVRFCDAGAPSTCRFPNEPWAAGFDANSSAYWCFKGSCRAHSSEPPGHPAYCMNCQ